MTAVVSLAWAFRRGGSRFDGTTNRHEFTRTILTGLTGVTGQDGANSGSGHQNSPETGGFGSIFSDSIRSRDASATLPGGAADGRKPLLHWWYFPMSKLQK